MFFDNFFRESGKVGGFFIGVAIYYIYITFWTLGLNKKEKGNRSITIPFPVIYQGFVNTQLTHLFDYHLVCP